MWELKDLGIIAVCSIISIIAITTIGFLLPLALTDSGVGALVAAVAEVTGVRRLDAAQPVLSTERQRQCAADCLACLKEAQTALAIGLTPDAVSVSVDGAINALLELTGERATEAVVEQVFARFCVGK